jgi:hypothetical protein
MASFAETPNPTPYGFFDSDEVFRWEADAAYTWVRRRLGDDVVTVEITKKQVWAALEEATLEYGRPKPNYIADGFSFRTCTSFLW